MNNIEQIDIKDVTYEYSKSIRTIDHINIDIKKGQHIAFVGRSGSGKSTLLKIAAGLLKPTSGNVLINGKDENKYGEYSLRNKI